MSTTDEIRALEERLRLAELGPDPELFDDVLADDAIIDGQRAKPMIVAAHRAGTQQFSDVQMRDVEIIDMATWRW